MKYFTVALSGVLLTLSCTRQPIGIAGSPNTPVQAPIEEGTVDPDPEIDEARVLREEERIAPGERATGTDTRGVRPDDAMARPRGRDDVRPRREAMESPDIETNETATIENQASVGQAPLTETETGRDMAQSEVPPAFVYQKSTCYGDCEAYTFSLQSGGLSSLRVDNGAIAEGLYERQLYSVDYESLNNSIDSLRELTFEPVYPVDEEIPTDIPYRLITLPDANGYPRNIKVYSGAPPALERFMDRLELLIGEQSWQRSTESDDE